ncbi:MAG: glycosyltransferase [candidate division FCPU426 bacterium]
MDPLRPQDAGVDVTLVIPAYNVETRIVPLLQSARDQQGAKVETLVVDDASTDRTAEVAEHWGARVVRNEVNLDRSEARNVGARAARGKYIWFIDSDMELTPGIAQAAWEACEREQLDGLVIPERIRPANLWAKSRNLEFIINDSDEERFVLRFVRRDFFLQTKGFDASLIAAEDYDYHRRMLDHGARYRLLTGWHVWHHELTSMRRVLKKYYYYGLTMSLYIRRHKQLAVRQFSFPRRGYLKRLDLLLGHPWLTASLFFFKTLQYAAGLAGIVMAWLGWDRAKK